MELVHEMKSRGLSMDDVLYGTLISVCASNNQCEEAEKYFDEMKSEGNLPNVFHYSSLLNAYAIDGNYRKADKVIQDMRSAGLTLNKVYFWIPSLYCADLIQLYGYVLVILFIAEN